MIYLAKNELLQLSKTNEEDDKKLKIYLLPKDEADSKNAILEIRAGTGGFSQGVPGQFEEPEIFEREFI